MSAHHLQLLSAAGLSDDAVASLLVDLAQPKQEPIVWNEDAKFWKRYKILPRVIGSGGFGDVYVGKNTEGKKFAIKILSRPSSNVDQEIQMARSIQSICSPHFVCYVEHAIVDFPIGGLLKKRAIVFDYVAGKDLTAYMDQEDDKTSKKSYKSVDMLLVEQWFCSALKGLAVLHHQKIAHRDVKAENIRVVEGDKVVYLDLGFSCHTSGSLEPRCNLTRIIGTPCITMSFDAAVNFGKVRDENFALAEDVYALAQSFYPFFTGFDSPTCQLEDRYVIEKNVEQLTQEETISLIIKANEEEMFATRTEILNHVGQERVALVDTFLKMLSPLAKDRPTAQAAFESLCNK